MPIGSALILRQRQGLWEQSLFSQKGITHHQTFWYILKILILNPFLFEFQRPSEQNKLFSRPWCLTMGPPTNHDPKPNTFAYKRVLNHVKPLNYLKSSKILKHQCDQYICWNIRPMFQENRKLPPSACELWTRVVLIMCLSPRLSWILAPAAFNVPSRLHIQSILPWRSSHRCSHSSLLLMWCEAYTRWSSQIRIRDLKWLVRWQRSKNLSA